MRYKLDSVRIEEHIDHQRKKIVRVEVHRIKPTAKSKYIPKVAN